MDLVETVTLGAGKSAALREDGGSRLSRRIMLAEDDREMRRILAKTLSAGGYEVIEAGSGLALLDQVCEARASNELPALIVSDIRMPGHSGLDVLRVIRGWGWEVPVILITGFGDETVKCEAAGAGGTCLFSKPFDIDDLCTAVMYFVP